MIRAALIVLAALTGCASLPDPANCEAYGVAIGARNTGPMQCKTVVNVPLGRRDILARCYGRWGCTAYTGRNECRVYWYRRDRWTLHHEHCHVRWGVRHDTQPKTVTEVLMGWRERVRRASLPQ